MTENPCTAPLAAVGRATAKVPEDIAKKIKNAWVAAVISGTLTLAVTLAAIFGSSILGYTAWELADVALVFGLAFGIYKRSRVCAVSMLVYFVAAKIVLLVETGRPNGLIVSIVFIYFFYLGVVGTFQYHRLVRSRPENFTGRA